MEALLSACFGYDIVSTPAGTIPRPEVNFSIQGPVQTLNLIGMMDSGSDITLCPLSVGQALGFNPSPQVSTYGVSGSAQGQIFNANITVAGKTFRAPIFVSMSEDSPILLGRAGVWSQFSSFTFHNQEQTLCFGEALPQPVTFGQPGWMLVGAAAVGGIIAWLFLK